MIIMSKKVYPVRWATTICVFLAALITIQASGQKVSVGIESDPSRPTFGLIGPSSSQMNYDPQSGLNVRGSLSDIFGPPIKIANGFSQILAGGNMAGLGTSMRNNGAILGFDSKLLEAAGGASALKGGVLMGGSGAKVNAANVIAGAPGKKIASIIELPVSVVAMKDLAAGKALQQAGQLQGQEAEQAKVKGDAMIKEGDALKNQGMNQVVKGATEGVANIGNLVQQTAGNAASAFRLLPILLDLPQGNQPQQQQQQQQIEVQAGEKSAVPAAAQPLDLMNPFLRGRQGGVTGGSLFGGLGSLLGGAGMLGAGAGGADKSPFNLFGQLGANGGQNHGFAAILNATNPLTSLLMNPALNPFLLGPIGESPLVQGLLNKQPIGTAGGSSLGSPLSHSSTNFQYNLLPGLKVSESMSSGLSKIGTHHPAQQVVEQQQQVVKS